MSDIVLNNNRTLTIRGKIKSSIIVEVGDPNSSLSGVSAIRTGIRPEHDQSLL
jgi:hypothetical protein